MFRCAFSVFKEFMGVCICVCVCFGLLVFVLCSYNFMIFTGLVFSIDDLNA